MRISDWSSDVCSSDLIGHDRVSILDGGYRAYAADPANPVETGWVDPVPEIFEAAFRPELVADRAAVQAALSAGRPRRDARDRKRVVEGKSCARRVVRWGHPIRLKKNKNE